MKVTGETFSFIQKEKKSRRGKMYNAFKLSAKGPLLNRTLESFLVNTEGVIFHYLFIIKKISQIKRQSKNNL